MILRDLVKLKSLESVEGNIRQFNPQDFHQYLLLSFYSILESLGVDWGAQLRNIKWIPVLTTSPRGVDSYAPWPAKYDSATC